MGKYRHRYTGVVAEGDSFQGYTYYDGNVTSGNPRWLPVRKVENSSDWIKEQGSKQWEVLHFNSSHKNSILSVRRTSDKEVFTIGHLTQYGFIASFSTNGDNLRVNFNILNHNQSVDLMALLKVKDNTKAFSKEDIKEAIIKVGEEITNSKNPWNPSSFLNILLNEFKI